MATGRRVFYLVPDHDVPSWGIGLLYGHVALLREAGIDAAVIHRHRPFRLSWIGLGTEEAEVPVRHLDDPDLDPRPGDLAVVPEVDAAWAAELDQPWQRVVFVQGSYLVSKGLGHARSYSELGYRHALAVLPHVKEVVDRFYGLEATLVRPYIAPYFFADRDEFEQPRARRLLLYCSDAYRQLGFDDAEVAARRLEDHLADNDWQLVQLGGLDHRATAELMKESTYLINLNRYEAFNTTVPEAMAAGCVPIAYEAFGGRDYLSHGRNSLVFPTGHLFALLEAVVERLECPPPGELARLRLGARTTADDYTLGQTRTDLLRFFDSLD